MKKKSLLAIAIVAAASPVLADSTYQNTCSNTGFVYQGSDAALSGVCLKSDGTPNQTTLVIKGVENDDGILKQTKAASSSFQKSCGSIMIKEGVLYADCRMSNGHFRPTSLKLPDIKNNNGELTY